MTASYCINKKVTLVEAEVQHSNNGGVFPSRHLCRIRLHDTILTLVFNIYIYAIYHCTIVSLDIKVTFCLHTEQTGDSWSLKVPAPSRFVMPCVLSAEVSLPLRRLFPLFLWALAPLPQRSLCCRRQRPSRTSPAPLWSLVSGHAPPPNPSPTHPNKKGRAPPAPTVSGRLHQARQPLPRQRLALEEPQRGEKTHSGG